MHIPCDLEITFLGICPTYVLGGMHKSVGTRFLSDNLDWLNKFCNKPVIQSLKKNQIDQYGLTHEKMNKLFNWKTYTVYYI